MRAKTFDKVKQAIRNYNFLAKALRNKAEEYEHLAEQKENSETRDELKLMHLDLLIAADLNDEECFRLLKDLEA